MQAQNQPVKREIPNELWPLINSGVSIDSMDFETNKYGRVVRLTISDAQFVLIHRLDESSEIEYLSVRNAKVSGMEFLPRLPKIRYLELVSCDINNIESVGLLHNLKHLKLSHNSISYIDPLGQLTNLETLNLSHNQIADLTSISQLSNLLSLSLKNNIISSLPLFKLYKLESLNMARNNVENISLLSTLESLKELSLTSNLVTDLGPLHNLQNLETLRLEFNNIENISPILNLKNLKVVALNANPIYNEIPPEVLETGWNGIRDRFLSVQKKDDLQLIKEAKLLLLGNSNVGKSDLLHFLQSRNIRTTHDSTHGLVYDVLDKLLKDCRIHCWDFGGQEFYHATHQLFFSPGALHLLLWSKKDEPRNEQSPDAVFELPYWLRCIQKLGKGDSGEVATIVIENKIDVQQYVATTLPQEQLKEQFPNLQLHFSSVSIKEKKRLEGLEELIKERLEVLFNAHPPKYKKYQEFIHSTEKAVLTIKEIGGNDDEQYVRTAMEVLRNIGCLLYFPTIAPDKVFTQPTVLLDLLYKHILDREKRHKVAKQDMEKMVIKNALNLKFEEIEGLLLHFNLIFSIPTEPDQYYIPQYLPPAPAWLSFFERNQFRKVFVRIVSDGYLINEAILKIFTSYACHVKAGDKQEPLFWKDGLVLEKDYGTDDNKRTQTLLIKFNREHHRIELVTSDEGENFDLQQEIVEFVTNMPESGSRPVIKELKSDPDSITAPTTVTGKSRPWQSKLFDIEISTDGKYFASWRDIITKLEKGIYSVEARADSGNTKIVSVFDYNQYLPEQSKGLMKKVFISYSKSDLALVNKFQEHLSALKLDGKVATWYCTELTGGSDWHADIQDRFNEADIVCFMISPNFMKTKYIHEHEIDRAFKRKEEDKAKGKDFFIVPIILDFCRWSTSNNNLAQYTALPYTAKPVMDFKNQNMAWYIIEECLRVLIDRNTQPVAADHYEPFLPDDVKRIYTRIVAGTIDA